MDNRKKLYSRARRIYGRFIVSIISFLLFIAAIINAHLIAQTGQIGVLSIVFIAIAVLILPRHSRAGIFVPSDEETSANENESDRLLRIRLAKLGGFTTYLRMIYFIIIVACSLGLPLLAPTPS